MLLQITLDAILNKIQTTVDGGIRITFDVPLSNSDSVTELMHYINKPLALGIVSEPAEK